eukprot:5774139-Amphidinium_carterae.1
MAIVITQCLDEDLAQCTQDAQTLAVSIVESMGVEFVSEDRYLGEQSTRLKNQMHTTVEKWVAGGLHMFILESWHVLLEALGFVRHWLRNRNDKGLDNPSSY